MSGHSKWHSIRHKKAAKDAQRGKVLTKHAKLILVAGRDDPNPDNNISLRNVIINAKADGVPKDNIDKLLKKLNGGDKEGTNFTQTVYEGFGPLKVPFMVTALTDNINRTLPEVRLVFEKNGGSFGKSGSVSFLFDQWGIIKIDATRKSEDEWLELVMEAGAEDFILTNNEAEIITAVEQFHRVRSFIEPEATVLSSQLEYRPKDPVVITGSEEKGRLADFIDLLDEIDDVDEVFPGFVAGE